jgi:rod shape determining protein RodA
MYLFSRRIRDIDWTLIFCVVALSALSIAQIYSIEPVPGMWRTQLLTLLFVGLPILFVTLAFDYHKITHAAPIFYGIGIILLIAVLIFGKVVNGNKSWLYIGPVGGQPSELAKIFTIMMLARYLSQARKRPLDFQTIAITVLLWAVPAILVFLENDTGSTLSYLSFLAAMLLIGGIGWRWIAGGVAAFVLVVILAGIALKTLDSEKYKNNYKVQRIWAVYFPEKAQDRYLYQNEQSEIAVGSGGVWGKGFRKGSQGSLGFLPEVQTDFIFAALGEERGFIGSLFALVLYLIVIMRLIAIARAARDRTGLLLVSGYAALLLCHVAVSAGMVLRLLPIIGIPMPLLSFGRSSLLATFFALGLVLNVRLGRFVN